METLLYQGPYGIILTPYREDGAIDFDELQLQVDKVCRTSISGLVACGSTGECAQLSPEENKAIMTAVAEAVGRRKDLICGATSGDARTAVGYLEHMAGLGAVGALTAPPYYFPLNDAEVLEFYRFAAANNFGVPIVAYHIPQFSSGVSMAVYRELLGMEQIRGIKNSSGNINYQMQMLDLRNRQRPGFSILTGSDEALYASLAVGGNGNFTAFAYLLPELVSFLYEHFGKDSRSLECQLDLLPLLRFAGSFTFPVGYKAVGEARGYCFGPYRQPLSAEAQKELDRLRPEIAAQIDALYEKYGCREVTAE